MIGETTWITRVTVEIALADMVIHEIGAPDTRLESESNSILIYEGDAVLNTISPFPSEVTEVVRKVNATAKRLNVKLKTDVNLRLDAGSDNFFMVVPPDFIQLLAESGGSLELYYLGS